MAQKVPIRRKMGLGAVRASLWRPLITWSAASPARRGWLTTLYNIPCFKFIITTFKVNSQFQIQTQRLKHRDKKNNSKMSSTEFMAFRQTQPASAYPIYGSVAYPTSAIQPGNPTWNPTVIQPSWWPQTQELGETGESIANTSTSTTSTASPPPIDQSELPKSVEDQSNHANALYASHHVYSHPYAQHIQYPHQQAIQVKYQEKYMKHFLFHIFLPRVNYDLLFYDEL